MKKLTLLFSVLFLCTNLFAQSPEALRSLLHTTESINATVWNDGFIGQNLVAGLQGTFSWKGTNGIYTAGLLFGTTSVGSVNGSYGKSTNYIDDWRNVESNFVGGFGTETVGSVEFDQVSTTLISDKGVPIQHYGSGFNVLQKSYSKSDENAVFFRYGFINTTGEDIADLYIGHATDWNIGNYYIYNAGGIDPSLNLTYISRTDSTGPYFGVVVIDSLVGCKIVNTIPLNLREKTFSYISVFDTTNSTTGNLHTVGGTYVDNILKDDTVWVTFAYIAGDDFEGLKTNAERAIEIARDAGWINAIPTEVADTDMLPKDYSLSQNYPNPFNPSTKISYSIPKQSYVSIKVFDVLGREVATLLNREQPIGNYEVAYDASTLTSGVYFYRIQAGDFVDTKKMILLR